MGDLKLTVVLSVSCVCVCVCVPPRPFPPPVQKSYSRSQALYLFFPQSLLHPNSHEETHRPLIRATNSHGFAV